MQQPVSGDDARRLTRAAMAVILIGAALRLAQYAAVRSLWLDEAMLANNIVGRGFGALLGPLGESQAAPWLFLFSERAAAMVLGPNELALRLLPLSAGILLSWVTWVTTSRLLDWETGVIATAAVALSPLLLYYANEVKPYGIDALATAVLLMGTVRVVDDPTDRRRWLVLIGTGAIGILSAFPAVFVVGAAWCALVASTEVRQSRHARSMFFVAAVTWAAAFAAPYVLVIRRATTDAFLTTYFSDRFLVPSTAIVSLWRLWRDVSVETFLGRDAISALPPLISIVLSVVLLIVCGLGFRAIHARRGTFGVLVVTGPIVLALAASALRVYPLTVRLWTFSAPLWALLVAAGIRSMAVTLRPNASLQVGALAAAVLLAPACVDAALNLDKPYWRRAHMRPLIRAIEDAQRSSGDAIYVMPRAAPQWLFYTTSWSRDPAPVPLDSAARWLEQRTCHGRRTGRVVKCQMIGALSSVTYSEVRGFSGTADSTWANREAARLKAAADPCVWVLMYLPYPGEPAALARAIDARGGHVDNALEDRMHPNRDAATKAFRICFTGPRERT